MRAPLLREGMLGVVEGELEEIPALATQRKLEAEYAIGWLKNIMTDAFA